MSNNIIKLRYTKDGEPQGREYSYFNPVDVKVGDLVEIETSGKPAKGIVTQIEVPEREIEAFKDRVKTILGKAKIKSTNEEAKAMIESILPSQENEDLDKGARPCPRCGKYEMKYPAVKNALSRRANVYICPKCGTDEAMLDIVKNEPLPFNEWHMVREFDSKRNEEEK